MFNCTLRHVAPRLLSIAFCAISLWGESAPVLLPIGKDRLVQSLEYRALTTDQLLERIAARGVDFELSDEDWKQLTRKGASSRIIAAIRANYRPTAVKEAKAVNATLADAQIYSGSPLLQREVELMLQMKVPLDKVTKAVAARGVDFVLTPQFVQQSFDLGANLVFVGELLLNSRAAAAPPGPEVLFANVKVEKAATKAAAPAAEPAPTPVQVALAPKPVEPKPQPVMVASSIPVAPARAAVTAPPIVEQPKPAAPGRLVVDAALQATKLVRQIPPVYPVEARAHRLSGAVKLELLIDHEGHVQNVRVLDGHPSLAAAAVSAARSWTYRPTVVDGQPMEVVSVVEIRFHP